MDVAIALVLASQWGFVREEKHSVIGECSYTFFIHGLRVAACGLLAAYVLSF